MNKSGFFCYKNYVIPAKTILNKDQYREYAVALLDLGIYGSSEVEDPLVAALLNQIAPHMNSNDRKYRHFQNCGKKGGRPRIVSRAEIENAVKQQGITTLGGLADHFQCSVRTISRYINKKEIRRFLDET